MSVSPAKMQMRRKITTFRQKKTNLLFDDDLPFKELSPMTPKVIKKEDASFTPKTVKNKE